MRHLRLPVLACVLAIGVGSLVSGQQQQRSATQDDLLAELRGLRADMNRVAQNTMRVQIMTARLALQEGRLGRLSQQLNEVHQQLAQSQQTLAPFTLQLKQAQESNSEIFAPLRNMLDQVQKRDRELMARETELNRLISSEESRGMDVNSWLDEIERTLLAAPRR